MGTDGSRERVWNLAEPVVGEAGLELVEVEVGGGAGSRTLRIFVDRATGTEAVSVKDCEAVSRRLGDVLDAHEEGRERYMLEVSSPGVNRRLRKPKHFARIIGERVRVRTDEKIDGRRNFLGRLISADDQSITVDDEGSGTVNLPLAAIERANYEHDFEAEAGRKR
ncbi:MAG: ribosome maturation factor RimP [Deltaproteobacteria bacterium]